MDAPGKHPASLLSGLSEARFQGYLFQPIPSDLDDEVRALVQAYQALDRDERSSLQALLIGEPVDILESFAERQAVFAVRSGSIEPVRLGLAALGMSFPRGDSAQALMALAKLDHSARLLGADLADVAFDALSFLPEQFRYFTAKFLAGDNREGSLLTNLGFAAYGSGPDFVYDNVIPGAIPAPAATVVPSDSGFVARQRYTSTIPGDMVAMRVKDGALVVTDERGRRSAFPFTGPGAPAAVVRAFKGTHRWWDVTDREGRAIVSGADDDWSRDAYIGSSRHQSGPAPPPIRCLRCPVSISPV